jgi:ubiquinone/menaquinone biosynthesis C-methylase UbiE
MNESGKKNHWENIYRTKQLTEVSWYEKVPTPSLHFFSSFHLPKNAKIIDVGGGDGLFVDYLLKLGYTDITVLDISAEAINRAKTRLGTKAAHVKWIAEDVANFTPYKVYDFWHDRATFHFLLNNDEIKAYIGKIKNSLSNRGYLVVGTFSDTGPAKCSGLEVQHYSETSLAKRFSDFFEKIKCISVDHITPFKTVQNFTFCSFKKLII